MTRTKIKSAYQHSKRADKKITAARLFLGEREIQTFKLLAADLGVELGPNKLMLDLGSADHFLEPACISEGWMYQGLDYVDVDFEVDVFPVQDNSVDFAVSLAVIEHLRDPENFLSEVFRCLKPGGLVYLSTPNFQFDWKNFYNDPTHVRPYTPTALEQLLLLSDFRSVATFPGLRGKKINWYKGNNRFFRAFYLLPFRGDTKWPVPQFLKGHARSIFALARKPQIE